MLWDTMKATVLWWGQSIPLTWELPQEKSANHLLHLIHHWFNCIWFSGGKSFWDSTSEMKSRFSRLWKCRMSETISQDFTSFLRPWRFLVLREWIFIPYQLYRLSIKHLPRYNNSFPNSLRRTSMWPCLEPNPPACGSSSAGHDPVGSLFVDCWWWYRWYWLHWHAWTLMICSYLFPGCTKGTCFGHGTSPVVLEDSNQEVLVELGWCGSTRTPLDWYHSDFCNPFKTAL